MALVPRRASPQPMAPVEHPESRGRDDLMVIDGFTTPSRTLFGTVVQTSGTPRFPIGMSHIMVAEETVGVFVNRLHNVERELSKISQLGIKLDQDIEAGYHQLQGVGEVQSATIEEIRSIQALHYQHLRLTRELDQSHQSASAQIRETIQALHEHHQQQAQQASAQFDNLGTYVNDWRETMENDSRQRDSNLEQRIIGIENRLSAFESRLHQLDQQIQKHLDLYGKQYKLIRSKLEDQQSKLEANINALTMQIGNLHQFTGEVSERYHAMKQGMVTEEILAERLSQVTAFHFQRIDKAQQEWRDEMDEVRTSVAPLLRAFEESTLPQADIDIPGLHQNFEDEEICIEPGSNPDQSGYESDSISAKPLPIPPVAPTKNTERPAINTEKAGIHPMRLLMGSVVTQKGGSPIEGISTAAPSGNIGYGILDSRVRDTLAKHLQQPKFSGKGEDWEEFIRQWTRWWKYSGVDEELKADFFVPLLNKELHSLCQRLITQGHNYDQIFALLNKQFQGLKNRFTARHRWENLKLPQEISLMTYTSWYIEWGLLGLEVPDLSPAEVKDRFMKALPTVKLQSLLLEQEKRTSRGMKFDSVEEWNLFIEEDCRRRDFVKALSKQVQESPGQGKVQSVRTVEQVKPRMKSCRFCFNRGVKEPYRRNHDEENCFAKKRLNSGKNTQGSTSGTTSHPRGQTQIGSGKSHNGKNAQEDKKSDPNTCHKCKQPGHWAKDCPGNKQKEPSGSKAEDQKN